jgi:hypothetical protein
MGYLSLDSTLPTTKYKGKKVAYVAQFDSNYLIWLHNSNLKIWLGKSVLEKLGVWNNYKNTSICNTIACYQK